MDLLNGILTGLSGVPISNSKFWDVSYPDIDNYVKFLGDGYQVEVEKKNGYWLIHFYSRGGHLVAWKQVPVSNKTKGIKFVKDAIAEAEDLLNMKFSYKNHYVPFNQLNGLGEDYTHSGGSYSSANGGTQTSYWDNSADIEAQRQQQAEIAAHNAEIAAHNAEVTMQNNDPYRQHILKDATTDAKYLLLSDGTTTWKIGGNAGASSRDANPFGSKTVAEVLHNWLSQNYRHGWIVGRTAQTSTDTEKTAAYATALANGKVISLTQVLQSVNPSTHVFYVPDGYFYAGDVSEVPSVSKGDANDAANRANYGNNLSKGDANDAANRANYGNNPFATTTAPKAEEDNTMLFLILPLAALVMSKMLKKNNKRKKR